MGTNLHSERYNYFNYFINEFNEQEKQMLEDFNRHKNDLKDCVNSIKLSRSQYLEENKNLGLKNSENQKRLYAELLEDMNKMRNKIVAHSTITREYESELTNKTDDETKKIVRNNTEC